MKKFRVETVVRKEDILYEVSCDGCGKTIKVDPQMSNENASYSKDWECIHHIHVSFGFGSRYDLEDWRIDICENCLDKFVYENLKNPPAGYGGVDGFFSQKTPEQLWEENKKAYLENKRRNG